MKENVELKDILLENKGFKEWSLEYKSYSNQYRLYVVKNKKELTFSFIVLEMQSYQSEEDEGWNSTAIVDELFSGTAIFDGVRHLNLAPYINYPSLDELSKIFISIRKLEEEFCSEL